MPGFGAQLGEAEIAAIADYVAGPLQAAPPATTTTTMAIDVPIAAGVAAGESLFLGGDRFENGGPACFACHQVGDRDNLSGPGLGPDLTGAIAAMGSTESVAVALANPHTGTLNDLYADDPLTPQEQSDLAAYLVSAARSGRGDRFIDGLIVMGLAGLSLLAGYTLLIRPREEER
jgi:mono/diheme cytochrome c family protein